MAVAAIFFGYSGECLFDVLAASGPGWLVAGFACNAHAHGVVPSFRLSSRLSTDTLGGIFLYGEHYTHRGVGAVNG